MGRLFLDLVLKWRQLKTTKHFLYSRQVACIVLEIGSKVMFITKPAEISKLQLVLKKPAEVRKLPGSKWETGLFRRILLHKLLYHHRMLEHPIFTFYPPGYKVLPLKWALVCFRQACR